MENEMRRQLIVNDGEDDDEQLLDAHLDDVRTPPPSYPQHLQRECDQEQQPVYPPGYYSMSPSPHQYQFQPPQVYAPLPAQQQQQQLQVINIGAQVSPIIIQTAPAAESYCAYIVTACCVLWLCNPPFGFVAFILAVAAECSRNSSRKSARHLGRASLCMSISGIVLTFIVIAVFVTLFILGFFSLTNDVIAGVKLLCPYTVDEACYTTRHYIGQCVTALFNTNSLCCAVGQHYSAEYCYSN